MLRLPTPASLLCGLIGGSLLLLSGCTTGLSRADRAFDAQNLKRAVAAYEIFLESTPDGKGRERALFRLALLYESPDSPVHNPQHARELFEQLVEEAPGHPYASLIGRSLYLESRLENLRGEIETQLRRRRSLELALEESRLETERLASELDASTEALTSRERETRELHGRLEKLLTEVAANRERAERLREALELLKRIDLDSPSQDTKRASQTGSSN